MSGAEAVGPQYVDPAVSHAKFAAEVQAFRDLEDEYRRRGWFLVSATFPIVTILFAATKTAPPGVVFSARFDYTNYDAEPPSVVIVHPFTGEPYLAKDIPAPLNRTVPGPELGPGLQLQQEQNLLQDYGPDTVPFLCVGGVREYHSHPGHSGDPWELQRTAGAGQLARLAEIIWRYGVDPINGYAITMVPRVGFQRVQGPE